MIPTIFCVEDDDSIRNLVVYTLNNSGFTAEGFCDGEAFFKALENITPDAVLLDVMLPKEDGLSILKRLRGKSIAKNLPVIMLTAKSSEYDKVVGLDLGADDYITKPFSMVELISRVKALLRRIPHHAEEQQGRFSAGEIILDVLSHTVTAKNQPVDLTIKEFYMLLFLLKNKGLVISRDTLLQNVWGYDYPGESRTVDVHVRTLRQKLGDEANTIETIRGVGYTIGANL